MSIGKHLATLNMFREADGRVFLTLAAIAPDGWSEVQEAQKSGPVIPHNVIMALTPEAAANSTEALKG
jgi:hypothetical protein